MPDVVRNEHEAERAESGRPSPHDALINHSRCDHSVRCNHGCPDAVTLGDLIRQRSEPQACGRPRRYFVQQTCELPRGHDGPHEDATHIWEDR